MSIPANWIPLGPDEPWGIGTEPFATNVPVGHRYTDAFGNRCVATDDGQYLVEGIGTGVNAGKPDGEWWPWTEFLRAGPTNAAPWIGTAPGLTPGEGTDETPVSAPSTSAAPQPQPPHVDVAPDGSLLSAEGADSPVVAASPHASEVPTATVMITPHSSGGVLVRIETATGEVVTKVVKMAEHLVAEVEAFAHQHFGGR